MDLNSGDTFKISVNGKEAGSFNLEDTDKLDLIATGPGSFHLLVNGQSLKLELKSIDLRRKRVEFVSDNIPYSVQLEDELDLLIHKLGFDKPQELAGGDITAPMPGLVLQIMVEEGQEVEADQPLLILEAMKMENVIKSSGAGTVKQIHVRPDDKVEKNKLLLTID